MFGIGIIGCGKIAQVRHIPEYAAHPEAKLVGFYDINQQRAAELAAKYGGRAYATVEELLAEPEIQAVSICAANFAHAELTIAALNAGKHVLCEKPMATNLADCEAMVQAADANGKFLMIGHNQRLAKAHSLARKLIVEGLIGDIITFRTIFGHGGPKPGPLTRARTPGSSTESGCHGCHGRSRHPQDRPDPVPHRSAGNPHHCQKVTTWTRRMPPAI